MANCSVLEAHQKPTDKPMRRIKRSGGQSLVRQGLAYWIRENVLLKMFSVDDKPPILCDMDKLSPQHKFRPYIPDKMPPNLDARLGIVVQVPALANQVRFRHF